MNNKECMVSPGRYSSNRTNGTEDAYNWCHGILGIHCSGKSRSCMDADHYAGLGRPQNGYDKRSVYITSVFRE